MLVLEINSVFFFDDGLDGRLGLELLGTDVGVESGRGGGLEHYLLLF